MVGLLSRNNKSTRYAANLQTTQTPDSVIAPTGKLIYSISKMVAAAERIQTENLRFCPISPVMRAELHDFERTNNITINLSDTDWTPTFNLGLYKQTPKEHMVRPFSIGRHGRDSHEKWLEDPTDLRQVFPENPDFKIKILGGAKHAEQILGSLPANWEIHEFGSLEPYEYLRDLDAFVYFPNIGLSEGFGRTIVEAMLAGVPVILPSRFAETFDELPLYADHRDVEAIIRNLAEDDIARKRYLEEVQSIAIARYSSAAIKRRFSASGLWGEDNETILPAQSLTEEAQKFRNDMMKVDHQ